MTVYGVAGGGLKDPSWLSDRSTAAVGLKGEEKTAALIESIAPNGVAIFHDLTIPGSRANVDHVAVSGKHVTLIDAKVWKPGTYWTLGGVTRRGFDVLPRYDGTHPATHRTRLGRGFAPADKRTMSLATKRLANLFLASGVHAVIRTPVIAVWSSRSNQRVNLLLARAPQSKLMNAELLTVKHLGSKPADPRIVDVLKTLLPR